MQKGRQSANIEDRRGVTTGPGFGPDNPFGDATFNRGMDAKKQKVLPYRDLEAEYLREQGTVPASGPLPRPRPRNPFQ